MEKKVYTAIAYRDKDGNVVTEYLGSKEENQTYVSLDITRNEVIVVANHFATAKSMAKRAAEANL